MDSGVGRPPPRPGSSSIPDRPGGNTEAGTASSHPPIIQAALCATVLLVVAACFVLGAGDLIRIGDTGRAVNYNTVGYVFGCFGGIFALYLFLVADNRSRATLRYADWRPFGARRSVGWITVASWAMGAAHLWFWALELTRP